MSINGHDSEDDALPPDPRLRAALGHAPDHAQQPPAALRDAVLRAAHAAAPKPAARLPARESPWWQRFFAPGPGALAAVAGVATAGLAINLAWRLSTEPAAVPATAPAPAVVAEMKAPAPAMNASASAGLAQAPSGLPAPATPAPHRAAPPPAAQPRRDARGSADAVASAAPPPIQATTTTSSAPVLQEREAVADNRAERARSLEPHQAQGAVAYAPSAPAAPAPAAFAPPAAAKAAGARPEAPAASPAGQGSPWPPVLGRWANALADGGPEQDLPAGWQLAKSAQSSGAWPAAGRGWWRALLSGTAGRWRPVPTAAPSSETAWQLRAPDGAVFTLWVEAEAVWLQADAALWRAPRPAGLAASP